MARTKTAPAPVEGSERWRKNGGGNFWMKGHIIKPGQVFYAREEDIPEAFRDQIVRVDFNPSQPSQATVKKEVEPKRPTYEKVLREDKGEDGEDLFNIQVKETKKILNTKGLTEAKAEKFLVDLVS